MRGVYIHIPFCEQKCAYCDFLSFPGHQEKNKRRYVAALCKEMQLRLVGEWQSSDTVFIGGGTPTALTVGELKDLLETLGKYIDISELREFTMEANPGTIDEEKLEVLLEGGVNRLSFGVQSFDDTLLKRIGRIHTAKDAEKAVEMARRAGFTNINMDLMYGLPGQTATQWRATVDHALSLAPTHLSLYQLIPEPSTLLVRKMAQGIVPPVDEEGAAEWFDAQREWLADEGYYQYEISNYAPRGYESIHNQLYWNLDDYLGLGLGATGWGRPIRKSNTASFQDYVSALEVGKCPPTEEELLTRDEQMSESVFMALRMNHGLNRLRFASLYDVDVAEVFNDAIQEGEAKGWLVLNDEALALTDIGRRMGNWVFELFL